MAKFKILYVDSTAHIGGAEISLINLLRRMNREVFAPVVVVPSEGRFTERLRRINVEIKIARLMEFSRRRWFSFLIATFRLASLIKKEEIDLVHANCIYISGQSLFAAKLAGVSCICHVRDLVPTLGAGKVRMIAFRKMDNIIAISDAVKRDLTEKLNVPEEKVVRIYNGVDTKEFDPAISGEGVREEFNLGFMKLVGMLGRLSPEKGHELFLRAGKEVLKIYPDVRLVIAGTSFFAPPEFKNYLIDLAGQLGIHDKVVFTGYREDTALVISALDIIVVPSIAEPFGRVTIEAMAMEKPVIATKTGASPEIVSSESGILIGSRDVNELAKAITDLLGNEARCKKLGKKARKIIKENFNIERNVTETERLYKQILRHGYK